MNLWLATEQKLKHFGTTAKSGIILLYALVGWLYCTALVGVGRQFLPMKQVLILHAIAAPVGFAILSCFYFKKYAFTSPLQTAFLFMGVVIAMDALVVAMLIEKSFAMFASPLGTWLPFAVIFCTIYLTGEFCGQGGNSP